jgi:hypothetical protein
MEGLPGGDQVHELGRSVDADHAGGLSEVDGPGYPSWGMGEPWEEDRSVIPRTDDHSVALIDEAVRALVVVRAPFGLDVLATISALVSLSAEVDGRLPDAVADAWHLGYCWDAIALRLAVTTRSARRRYASYARWRRALRVDGG